MRLFQYAFMTAVIFGLTACGSSGSSEQSTENTTQENANQRVYNGQEISPYDAAQVVQIVIYSADGGGSCTGTVIGSNSVLTATHCFLSPNITAAYVRLYGGVDVPISELYVAPGFGGSGSAIFNDLAIVKTAQPLGLAPVAIGASTGISSELALLGYGLDENNIGNTLRIGVIYPDAVTENHILDAVNGGQNSCKGDSGGPLLQLQYNPYTGGEDVALVGIVSSGTSYICTNQGDLSYYTNVQNPGLLSFIAQVVPDAQFI